IYSSRGLGDVYKRQSLLCGAMLLLLADTLARTVAAPAEMPVGLLTSVLGAPWFLWLIFRREKGTHG
ncbi:iron chelate uptake ABC transporter family permease subunit, partial [Klebsiella michiganensis]|uniref:iron chelate uptake ABC transporter family permease subunit n=1 Tax=Klebsiella michiganensis TaxID=1134687 RepID=UPI001912307D